MLPRHPLIQSVLRAIRRFTKRWIGLGRCRADFVIQTMKAAQDGRLNGSQKLISVLPGPAEGVLPEGSCVHPEGGVKNIEYQKQRGTDTIRLQSYVDCAIWLAEQKLSANGTEFRHRFMTWTRDHRYLDLRHRIA